jgi:hypothetical protein
MSTGSKGREPMSDDEDVAAIVQRAAAQAAKASEGASRCGRSRAVQGAPRVMPVIEPNRIFLVIFLKMNPVNTDKHRIHKERQMFLMHLIHDWSDALRSIGSFEPGNTGLGHMLYGISAGDRL